MEEIVVVDFQTSFSQFMQDNMTFFIVVCVFILLDIISGVVASLIKGDYSSTVMRKGLAHKLAYIFIMCAVAVLQVAMFDPHFHVDFDFPLLGIVCGFIIFMELSSILENACVMNPQINELIGKFFVFNKHNDIEF